MYRTRGGVLVVLIIASWLIIIIIPVASWSPCLVISRKSAPHRTLRRAGEITAVIRRPPHGGASRPERLWLCRQRSGGPLRSGRPRPSEAPTPSRSGGFQAGPGPVHAGAVRRGAGRESRQHVAEEAEEKDRSGDSADSDAGNRRSVE